MNTEKIINKICKESSSYRVPSFVFENAIIKAKKNTRDISVGDKIDRGDKFKVEKIGDRGSIDISALNTNKYGKDLFNVNPNDFIKG